MSKQSPFCPVDGCETPTPHAEQVEVAALLKAYSDPAKITAIAIQALQEIIDSAAQDVAARRRFALLTRMRQVQELVARFKFCLLVADREELPHYLAEANPNRLWMIEQRNNDRLLLGLSTLHTDKISGPGPNETTTVWSMLNRSAHVSNRAMSVAFGAVSVEDLEGVWAWMRGRMRTLEEVRDLIAAGLSNEEIVEAFRRGASDDH